VTDRLTSLCGCVWWRCEAPEKPEPLEVGDEQALMMKEQQAKGGRSKARPAVSWLRRTEYMGTDLYDAVHKVPLALQTSIMDEIPSG
jgi:hypothetical protein